MQTSQIAKFLSPLQSLPENQARAGFFPAGRYHGFDQFNPRTPEVSGNYSIVVFHGDGTDEGAIKVGDATNTLVDLGYLVTRHGLVAYVSIPTPTDGVGLDLPINSGTDPVFYLFLGSHAWTDSANGNAVYYESRLWDPTDPDDPDPYEVNDLGATEFILGYFKVMPGAKDYTKVTLVPAPTPQFAWNSGIPYGLLSKLARRDQDNTFTGINANSPVDGATYNTGNLTLTILSTTNLCIVSYTSVQEITSISWAAAPNGSPLIMIMEDVSPSVFTPGGNIKINKNLPITNNSVFHMVKWDGNFYVVGSANSLTSLIDAIPPPVPPTYGPWVYWVPTTVPSTFKTGGSSSGESSFICKYRTDGVGGYVIKISLQVFTAINSPAGYEIGSVNNPFPFNLGEDKPGRPIVAPLLTPFTSGPASPAFISVDYHLLKIVFPATMPLGIYTTPEITLSAF